MPHLSTPYDTLPSAQDLRKIGVRVLALLMVLIDKGVITDEEYAAALGRATADVDESLAKTILTLHEQCKESE